MHKGITRATRSGLRWLSSIALTMALPLTAAAMEVEVKVPYVILSGSVNGTEMRALKAALEENPGITTVVLKNSPGGDARTGYMMGEFIRERGLNTGVSGLCASSCSRFFLGGKERFFTDDQPLNRTAVALHGNYGHDGKLIDTAVGPLKAWIIKYSDGKARPDLVEQWVRLPINRGMAYFYHPTESPAGYGPTRLLICQGTEENLQRSKLCAKPDMGNALDNGIVTSLEVLKVR
ncbi:hypothetical protein FN976_26890 [Caenimonas sedimenti]|uniref:Uncharacterized protein n=1 Tax=Caenimonas sedimenti TaxID=2596921 RepID=A0A562ZFA1_9BURK|nr:hypothetical protein [Caenimonas sedimenti]TWO66009.1 hypothetical protein FN976_26890 [Caenimonas sedimenti]